MTSHDLSVRLMEHLSEQIWQIFPSLKSSLQIKSHPWSPYYFNTFHNVLRNLLKFAINWKFVSLSILCLYVKACVDILLDFRKRKSNVNHTFILPCSIFLHQQENLPVLCAARTRPCLITSRTQGLTFSFPSPPTTDTTRLGTGRSHCDVISEYTLSGGVSCARRRNLGTQDDTMFVCVILFILN